VAPSAGGAGGLDAGSSLAIAVYLEGRGMDEAQAVRLLSWTG
jgi:hypothetical protein